MLTQLLQRPVGKGTAQELGGRQSDLDNVCSDLRHKLYRASAPGALFEQCDSFHIELANEFTDILFVEAGHSCDLLDAVTVC